MAKIYEVHRKGAVGAASLNEEGAAAVKEHREFHPRKGVAKRAARVLNEGKRLTDKSGISVVEHKISGGRQGLCDFINALVSGKPVKAATDKKSKAAKSKPAKSKGKPKRGKKK
jgi:hypothetical protein